MSPFQLGAAAGLALAAVSTFLEWVSVGGQGVASWDGGFQIADWVGSTAAIDAIAVLVLAGAGLYMLVAPLLGWPAPAVHLAAPVVGVLLAVLGVVEFVYINGFEDAPVINGGGPIDFRIDFSPAVGIYLLIAGGLTAGIFGYLAVQRESPAGTGISESA